jgi:hypothetical protein
MKRYSLMVVVCSLVAGFVGGALSGKVFAVRPVAQALDTVVARAVKAQGFYVVDKNGALRASLHERALFLGDENGKLGVMLSTESGLVLSEQDKKLRVTLHKDGLTLYDENGKKRALLVKDFLGFYDENGKPRIAVFAGGGEGGKIGIALWDRNTNLYAWYGGSVINFSENGKSRTVIGKDGLYLFDENEKLRAVLGVAELEKTKTGEGITTAPSSLVLFDKEGKMIFKAPSE